MDAFASPSIRAETLGKGWLRVAEGIILTLSLGLSLMGYPGPPDSGLDGSWQEMLVHAHAVGLQFGRDIIFTWGPWGFLGTRFHLGSLAAVPILVWQTAGQFLVALCLVNLTWTLSVWRRVAFYVGLIAFHWLFQDTVFFVLIALAGIGPLMKADAKIPRLVLWAVLLGFLAQLKFTYFVISAAAVLASAACQSGRRSKRAATAIIAAYAFSVLVSWVAAGQSLDNLYPYIRRSLEISSGYGDAMGLDESGTVFGWGAAIALSCVLFCWSIWRSEPDRPLAKASSLLLFFILFVMWKEAYTRADYVVLGGHIFGLIGLVFILVPAASGLLRSPSQAPWFEAAPLLCLLALAFVDPGYYSQVLRIEWQRIYGNVMVLENLRDQPAEWESQLAAAAGKVALPATKAAVGAGTIDTYNFQEGVAILNDLKVSARPIFQSYSAYTPSLEGWNLRNYQSDRAPDYLLWNDGRVDNRYPGEDDALLVESLPGQYAPVLEEGGYHLFRRLAHAAKTRPLHRFITKATVRLGEPVEIPAGLHEAVWLEADAVPNALGRARALLYKPAEIGIVTTDETGKERSWRLLPRVARAGFILVPTLEHAEDLEALMDGVAPTWVRRIRFDAPAGQDEFWSHIDVNVMAIPSLSFAAIGNSTLLKLGIYDRRPVSIKAFAELELVDIAGAQAMLLHAPGSMEFVVPARTARFSGTFGLRPGAYSDGGHTAGVEFAVDAVWSSGKSERIWSRFLDPVGNPGDRGAQHFDVALPPDGAAKIILSTGPGPTGDNRWDWSYVRALCFETNHE
jgi:hypothetical protein